VTHGADTACAGDQHRDAVVAEHDADCQTTNAEHNSQAAYLALANVNKLPDHGTLATGQHDVVVGGVVVLDAVCVAELLQAVAVSTATQSAVFRRGMRT
jgi:hypothetical protein